MNWVLIRKEEVVGVFNNRKNAVKHLKALIRQTLRDFNTQDKEDSFDYSFTIPETTIKPVKERKAFLGL